MRFLRFFYRRWMWWRWERKQKKNPMPETGFYWHLHHDLVCEWCYSYTQRAYCIIWDKPCRETKQRLKLFQPVKNVGELPKGYVEAVGDKSESWNGYLEGRLHKGELEVCHKKEHPDCPWDGHTIFLGI